MRKGIDKKPGIVSEMDGPPGCMMAHRPKALRANKDSFKKFVFF